MEISAGTSHTSVNQILVRITNLPPPPPPPPPPQPQPQPQPQPAILGLNTHLYPGGYQSGGFGGGILLGAAPQTSEQPSPIMARSHLPPPPPLPPQPAVLGFNPLFHPGGYQSGGFSGGVQHSTAPQWLGQPSPMMDPPNMHDHPLSQTQSNNIPAAVPPKTADRRPEGMLCGNLVHGYPASFNSAAPPAYTYTASSIRRDAETQQITGQLYIKKPPNAFILFSKEWRQKVAAECNITESATVNKILGSWWNRLSSQEKAKYYFQANVEKLLHAQRYPGWSPAINYGKNKKKKTLHYTPATRVTASEPEPEVDIGQMSVSSLQTGVMQPQTGVKESLYIQTGLTQPQRDVTEPPHTQAAVREEVSRYRLNVSEWRGLGNASSHVSITAQTQHSSSHVDIVAVDHTEINLKK